MKKVFARLLLGLVFVLTLTLSACGDKGGTFYPTNEEMKANLEKSGYTVEVCDDTNKHEFFVSFSSMVDGTAIKAVNGNDYIYFFRLTEAWRCDTVYDALEDNCQNYNSLVKIENDEKFGNIVYCGTKNAIDAAGIKVVDVKVNV